MLKKIKKVITFFLLITLLVYVLMPDNFSEDDVINITDDIYAS